jgi:hypothetical protein
MRGNRLGRKEVYWVLKAWRKRHRSRSNKKIRAYTQEQGISEFTVCLPVNEASRHRFAQQL